MGALEYVKKAITDWVSLEDEESTIYELECNDCGTTFMTESQLEAAACEDCGSNDLREEGVMYVGGGGVEGA